MALNVKYANYEGAPARFCFDDKHTEAWWLPGWPKPGSVWRKIDSAEIGMLARPMDQETFENYFPDLPPLPSEAFNDTRSTTERHSGG